MQKITRCDEPHTFYYETEFIGKGESDMEILETDNNHGRDCGYSQIASRGIWREGTAWEQRALMKDIIKTYHTLKILWGSTLDAGWEAISCQIGSLLHGAVEDSLQLPCYNELSKQKYRWTFRCKQLVFFGWCLYHWTTFI